MVEFLFLVIPEYQVLQTQDERYKLYKDGRFFDLEKDVLELSPIEGNNLTKDQKTYQTTCFMHVFCLN